MKIVLMLVGFVCLAFTSLAQEDVEGCKDSPLFTRYPNFNISYCFQNYNEVTFRVKGGGSETKEGNLFHVTYSLAEGAKTPSPLQVIKNYENAVVKTGGKVVYKNTSEDDLCEATFTLRAYDKDYWIKLGDFTGVGNQWCESYKLYILEMEPMKQEIQATEMFEALNKDGFVALYINFETGKADIKPESQAIVDQIAEMLQQNSSLKISIEGHTDNVGSPASNKALSERRAKSVMNGVIAKGIEKNRLAFKGWGNTKPLADNSTEDGKAKNRRVEIVKL